MAILACKRPRKTATGERGQALLELLPVMLLLLTLTFAVIDFGRAIWQVQVITGLTREGSNLASRHTSLTASAAAVMNDGQAVLNSTNCYVVITSVQNEALPGQPPAFVIMDQTSLGTLPTTNVSAISKIGVGIGNSANLPVTTPTVPPPGGTVYVTEIYNTYSAITPLGALVNFTTPGTIYDVAYF